MPEEDQHRENQPQAEITDEYWESLLNHRSSLIDSGQKEQASYDKTLIYLQAGALALTFGLLTKLTNNQATGFLIAAWACWTLGLLAVVCSFGASVRDSLAKTKHLDEWMSKPDGTEYPGYTSKWYLTIVIANWVGLVSFALGVIMFAIFAFKADLRPSKSSNHGHSAPSQQSNEQRETATQTSNKTGTQDAPG